MKIALVALLSCLVLSSCLKKQDLDSRDLGPAASPDEVQSKMMDAATPLYLNQIQKNEISSLVFRQTLEDSRPTKFFQQDLYVTGITVTPDKYTVELLYNYQDFENTANSLSNISYHMIADLKTVAKSTSSSNSVNTLADVPDPIVLVDQYEYYAKAKCRLANITCHNFTVESQKKFIPHDIADSKICPDINNCLIDYKIIQFDILDGNKTVDGRASRAHLTFYVSKELPALSRVFKFCQRALQFSEANNRNLLVESCFDIDLFSYGQDL